MVVGLAGLGLGSVVEAAYRTSLSVDMYLNLGCKDIPLLRGFLPSLFSVAHCLALLKLRPYGAIQYV